MKVHLIVAAGSVLAFGGAHAYETGSLSCDNIGEMAAQTLISKQSGVPLGEQLTKLGARLPPGADTERTLIENLVRIIYENDLLVGMKPSDAYAVFSRDCMRGQAGGAER